MTNWARHRLALVTGSTDGIGLEVARQLLLQDVRVILHGRSRTKAEATRTRLEDETEKKIEDVVVADLAGMDQVRGLGEQLRRDHPELQIVIHNAGLFSRHRVLTVDGYERHWAVHYLAPFLLTLILLDRLHAHAPARVINVTSVLHQDALWDWQNLQGERRYDGYAAYGTSKLALVLFTVELAARLEGTGVTVNCVHPGGVETKLLRAGFGGGGITPAEGARDIVALATEPRFAEMTGRYVDRQGVSEPDRRVADRAFRQQLWRWTENVLAAQLVRARSA